MPDQIDPFTDGENCIFLTRDKVVESVCNDFRQYEPQILLFCEVIRLISGGDTVVRKMPDDKNGVWVRVAGLRNLRWMEGPELVEHMCATLKAVDLAPDLLAAIASRVFQTRALPAVDPATGHEGFLIETGMENFHCRQCGHCCQSLDYSYEVTAADVDRWRKLGRTDILKWVGSFKDEDGQTVYQIWVTPGTRHRVDICPFLKQNSAETRWYCRIHDAKPAICREYPVGRKHALMTGCPGFEKECVETNCQGGG
jgi:Fe-S-cluster containining protein